MAAFVGESRANTALSHLGGFLVERSGHHNFAYPLLIESGQSQHAFRQFFVGGSNLKALFDESVDPNRLRAQWQEPHGPELVGARVLYDAIREIGAFEKGAGF